MFLNLSTECCHAAGIIAFTTRVVWMAFIFIDHTQHKNVISHTNDTKWNWMARHRAKRLKSSVMHNEARYIKQFQLPKDLLLCCCLSHNIHGEWNVDDEERCESHFHITAFDVSEKKRGSAYHPMYIFNAEEYEWRSRRKVWVKSSERERVPARRELKSTSVDFYWSASSPFIVQRALLPLEGVEWNAKIYDYDGEMLRCFSSPRCVTFFRVNERIMLSHSREGKNI